MSKVEYMNEIAFNSNSIQMIEHNRKKNDKLTKSKDEIPATA